MKNFSHSFSSDESPEEVRRTALTDLAPDMGKAGFPLDRQDDHGLTFVSRYRSSWIWLCCIIFFPLGLLALLVPKRIATVVMTIDSDGKKTWITFTGQAHRSLRKQLEAMNDEPDRDRSLVS